MLSSHWCNTTLDVHVIFLSSLLWIQVNPLSYTEGGKLMEEKKIISDGLHVRCYMLLLN